MKLLRLVVWTLCCFLLGLAPASAYPPAPASQTQVNAGTEKYLYVTPATLAAWTGATSPTGGVSAATATNIAAGAAAVAVAPYLPTNGSAANLTSLPGAQLQAGSVDTNKWSTGALNWIASLSQSINNNTTTLGNQAQTNFQFLLTVNGGGTLNSSLTMTSRVAIAKAMIGQTNANVAFLGDSDTMGYGSTNTSPTNCMDGSFVRRLAKYIPNATADNWWPGSGWWGANPDSRITFATNWTTSTYATLLGNLIISATNGSTGSITFHPDNACDFVNVLYFAAPGKGGFHVWADGVTDLGGVSTGAAAGGGTNTIFPVTYGTHYFEIRPDSTNTGAVQWQGTICGTAANSLNLLNWGWSGATAVTNGYFNVAPGTSGSAAYGAMQTMLNQHIPLNFICLGVNDANLGLGVTAYSNGLYLLAYTLRTNGSDVVIVSPPPVNTANDETPYAAAAFNVASNLNCGFVDVNGYFRSYAALNGAGMMYNALHLNAYGYEAMTKPFRDSGIFPPMVAGASVAGGSTNGVTPAQVGVQIAQTNPVVRSELGNLVNTNQQTNVWFSGYFTPEMYKTLDRFRARYAGAMLGQTNVKVGIVGDSHTAAYGGTGASTPTNCILHSPPYFLAQMLPNGNSDWAFSTHGYSLGAADPRLQFGTNWTEYSGADALCGKLIGSATNSSTNAIVFTPSNYCDHVEVLYHDNFDRGSASLYDETGTLLGKIVPSLTPATLTNQVFACTYGRHSFSLRPSSTNTTAFYFSGIGSYVETNSISIINLGMSGYQSTNWNVTTASGFGPLVGLTNLGLDLVIIQLGVNENYYGTSTNIFATNLLAFAQALQAKGISVVLATPIPVFNDTSLDPYIRTIRGVAQTNGLALACDLFTYFGSYARMNNTGEIYASIHPSELGYMDTAMAYYHCGLWNTRFPQTLAGNALNLTNMPVASLNWTFTPSTFTNINCVRIPVGTNAGIVYYLTLGTNAP